MSIALPDELVWVMSPMGLNRPDIDEDEMREWARHVREFGHETAKSHGDTDVMLNCACDIRWNGGF